MHKSSVMRLLKGLVAIYPVRLQLPIGHRRVALAEVRSKRAERVEQLPIGHLLQHSLISYSEKVTVTF
jgi:hypothetical protein